MELVKNYSLKDISNKIFGKKVRFKSTCEFFPNFDVSCKVNNIYIDKSEIMFKVTVLSSHKQLIIGGNMKELTFELL